MDKTCNQKWDEYNEVGIWNEVLMLTDMQMKPPIIDSETQGTKSIANTFCHQSVEKKSITMLIIYTKLSNDFQCNEFYKVSDY